MGVTVEVDGPAMGGGPRPVGVVAQPDLLGATGRIRQMDPRHVTDRLGPWQALADLVVVARMSSFLPLRGRNTLSAKASVHL